MFLREGGLFLSGNKQNKMCLAALLTFLIFIIKLVGGYWTNSLALVSDAWHSLTDLLALLLSWWALRQSQKAATLKHTFGFQRFGILAALVNNISLLLVSFYIFYQAYLRFFRPQTIAIEGMLLLALLGLLTNGLIIWSLHGEEKNINIRSAWLHFVGDALASLGVLVGGMIIYCTEWLVADTIISAFIGLTILKTSWDMLVEIVHILLEGVPPHINILQLVADIKKMEGIKEVTDIHVWSLSSEEISMSAHICVENKAMADSSNILQKIVKILQEGYGISHSTIQLETAPCRELSNQSEDYNCHLCLDCHKKKLFRKWNNFD